MKRDLVTLKDSFIIGYRQYVDSRRESERVAKYFHNEQYSQPQINKIKQKGQPAETFNVIKLYARMLLGYYATVINDIQVLPRKEADAITAGVLNDLIEHILQKNNFSSEADNLKLDLILSGLMCCYETVEPTGEFDEFNRPRYRIKLQHIPVQEIILDPMSKKSDYSDAKYIHRFKWISEEDFKTSFGQAALDKAVAYEALGAAEDTNFYNFYKTTFAGYYRDYKVYLVVHSVVRDGDRTYSVFWNNASILDTQELTYREVPMPYRIQKLYDSITPQYYGIFREIMETQDSINQALLKIQQLVNTQKAMVQDGAVENMEEFSDAFYRVNAIIPVKDITGIQVINMTKDISDCYNIIDSATKRIKDILGINDSFLGMAYASESGKKVQIQQQATVVSLKYLSTKIENFYRLLGKDILGLIKQYFTAYDVLDVVDDNTSQRWIQINVPMIIRDKKGKYKYLLEEHIDPETGKPLTDSQGNIIMAPVPTEESDIQFTEADVRVESVSYNNDQEQNQTLLDSFLSGASGQFLMQTNPAGYARAVALSLKNMKLRISPDLVDIMDQTAQLIDHAQQQQQQQQGGMLQGQGQGLGTALQQGEQPYANNL